MREKIDDCGDNRCIEERRLANLRENMLEEEIFLDVADTFQVLSDATRVKIVFVLAEGQELCVHHIASLLNMSPSAVSHQLRQLRNMRLVKNRKEGQHVYYSLSDNHIVQLFRQCLEHVEE